MIIDYYKVYLSLLVLDIYISIYIYIYYTTNNKISCTAGAHGILGTLSTVSAHGFLGTSSTAVAHGILGTHYINYMV